MLSSGPYPGLRPYDREESSIFFGREELCNELLDKLAVTRFLPIVGPSGCGKSSLVRAGVLADLIIGFMPGTKDHWRVAEMRPGNQPFKNLADALQNKSALGLDDIISLNRLRSGLGEFIDMMEEIRFPEDTNLLLLVDQFEEIFRYCPGGSSNRADVIESSRDEADAFVSLLLALSAQQVLPIYVVITMRTDFIGDCAKFNRLPEAINRGLFLVPRLTKLQLQRAIVEPARVFDCEVEDALVSRLLNDVGTDPDDLPLMQHVLMRIYNQAEGKKLTYQKYLDVGGFESALSEHANEAYSHLTEKQKPIAEKLFRCLSLREKDHGRDTRCPTQLGKIADVCIKEPEEDEEKKKAQLKKILEELVEVVDVFRQPRYSFITPPVSKEKEIDSDTILDISHESLIRQWKPTLEDWIKAEAKSVSDYFQLEKNAKRWGKEGKNSKWLEPMPHLQISLDWKKRENPTPAWAERYKFYDKEEKEFDLTMEFLEESENAFKRKKIAEKQAEEKEQQLEINRITREAELVKERAEKAEREIELQKERAENSEREIELAKAKHRTIKTYCALAACILILIVIMTLFGVDHYYKKELVASNEFLSQGKFEEAIEHCENALFWDDDHPGVYITKGIAFAQKKMYPKAISIFEKGIKKASNSYRLHLHIGHTYLKSKNEKDAVQHFMEVIKLSRFDIDGKALFVVVNSLLRSENVEDIKDAIYLAPRMVDMAYYDKLINECVKEGKNPEADYYLKLKEDIIRDNQKSIKIDPEKTDSSDYTSLGYDLLKTGKVDEAINQFKKAIEIDPEKVNADVYIIVGHDLLKKDEEKDGIKHFKKAIQMAPEKINAHVYTIVGYDSLKAGKLNEAIAPFKNALNLMKKYPSQSNESDIDAFKTNIETKLTQRGEKEDSIRKFLENVGF